MANRQHAHCCLCPTCLPSHIIVTVVLDPLALFAVCLGEVSESALSRESSVWFPHCEPRPEAGTAGARRSFRCRAPHPRPLTHSPFLPQLPFALCLGPGQRRVPFFSLSEFVFSSPKSRAQLLSPVLPFLVAVFPKSTRSLGVSGVLLPFRVAQASFSLILIQTGPVGLRPPRLGSPPPRPAS